MVEITEDVDGIEAIEATEQTKEPPKTQQDEGEGSSIDNNDPNKHDESKKSTDSDEEWNKLMGENIQLKILKNDNDENKQCKECQPQDAAVIDVIGRFAPTREDDDGPIFHQATDCLIVVGDKYVNPALEMGVRFMSEGQRAILWSHSKFAYGLATRKWNDYELPPNSNVRYEIHVKSIISPKEESTDPDAFQLRLAMSKKLLANDIFQNELYKTETNKISEQRAIRLYKKAADEMQHLLESHAGKEEEDYDETGVQQLHQAKEIMLDCLNNVVAVHLKAKRYHEAKEAAVYVLTHDRTNFKALIRAARAAMLDPAGTYEESDVAIAAAEKVVQERNLDDKEVRKLRVELKQQKQEYKRRKKEMMARMTKDLTPQEQSAAAAEDTTLTPQQQQEQQRQQLKEAMLQQPEEEEQEVQEERPLWRRLLPYAIQIIFPFVLYYVVVMTSKPHQQRIPKDDGHGGEL